MLTTQIVDKELLSLLQALRKGLFEEAQPTLAKAPAPVAPPQPKQKTPKVIFDKSTGAPFEVIFSERGFLVDDTRMSFEELETAISKDYNIVLQGGKGLVLDAVKMQKILKYKDRF